MKTKKILIILMLIMSFSIIFQINTVQAALQSNGTAVVTKNRNEWMTQIRQMEALGGSLGLEEQINTTNLTATTESNKLDIHMQKNTEYGAMALLSASSYGKPDKIEANETTTGNETGVVIPNNKEWTAAQYTDIIGSTTYAGRYINYYSISSGATQKRGDALLETKGWHNSTNIYYYKQEIGKEYNGVAYQPYYGGPGGILRNIGNGIFGFANDNGAYWVNFSHEWGKGTKNAAISQSYTSRAVIINGEGI